MLEPKSTLAFSGGLMGGDCFSDSDCNDDDYNNDYELDHESDSYSHPSRQCQLFQVSLKKSYAVRMKSYPIPSSDGYVVTSKKSCTVVRAVCRKKCTPCRPWSHTPQNHKLAVMLVGLRPSIYCKFMVYMVLESRYLLYVPNAAERTALLLLLRGLQSSSYRLACRVLRDHYKVMLIELLKLRIHPHERI